MIYIPQFDADEFMLAVRLVRSNPDFLGASEYPDDIKEVLLSLTNGDGNATSGAEELDLKAEVVGLINDLRETRDGLKMADTAEKAMYFRTMTQNLSTLVKMLNDLIRMEHVGEFMREVIDIMERYLDKDQISELHGKIKELSEQ